MKRNKTKEEFLKKLNSGIGIRIGDHLEKLSNNIVFSFQYFDNSQESSSDFCDLTHDQLKKIVEKIKKYSCNTIEYWKNQRIGKRNSHVLEVYGNFPQKSEFFHPRHIPQDVSWARFRLENDMRLVGFIIDNKICEENNLAKNVFYVVFIDEEHRFYKQH